MRDDVQQPDRRTAPHGAAPGGDPPPTEHPSVDPADLDMSVEAMSAPLPVSSPGDPWLRRRMLSFGASEVPALLYALGVERPWPNTPAYVLDLSRRILGVKAGTRRPAKAGQAAQIGTDAEPDLVAAWNRSPLSGWPLVTHASRMPREFLPLLDRECPRLSATPDGWCRVCGDLVLVEVKTDQRGQRTEPTREWRWQVQAQMAVVGCDSAILLYGPGWAAWDMSRRGPISAWVIERDDEAIERIRAAAAEGWRRVEEIRSGKAAEGGA